MFVCVCVCVCVCVRESVCVCVCVCARVRVYATISGLWLVYTPSLTGHLTKTGRPGFVLSSISYSLLNSNPENVFSRLF